MNTFLITSLVTITWINSSFRNIIPHIIHISKHFIFYKLYHQWATRKILNPAIYDHQTSDLCGALNINLYAIWALLYTTAPVKRISLRFYLFFFCKEKDADETFNCNIILTSRLLYAFVVENGGIYFLLGMWEVNIMQISVRHKNQIHHHLILIGTCLSIREGHDIKSWHK